MIHFTCPQKYLVYLFFYSQYSSSPRIFLYTHNHNLLSTVQLIMQYVQHLYLNLYLCVCVPVFVLVKLFVYSEPRYRGETRGREKLMKEIKNEKWLLAVTKINFCLEFPIFIFFIIVCIFSSCVFVCMSVCASERPQRERIVSQMNEIEKLQLKLLQLLLQVEGKHPHLQQSLGFERRSCVLLFHFVLNSQSLFL